MANNATITVKKPGHINGTPTPMEYPAEYIAGLEDNEPMAVVIESPIGSGKFYRLDQVK